MEIKDLAGLSEPLKRLIEVVSDGVGAFSKPYLIKRTADAKAYEIKTIATAIHESREQIGQSDYIDGQVVMASVDPEPMLSLEDRSSRRQHFQQQKAQQNIEAIAANAADDLSKESSISPEKPDPDWISRFFDTAENISSQELQLLWGRILAGEIKQPGRFSLRSLDIIKNISRTEAELFSRLANFVLQSDDKYFVAGPQTFLGEVVGGLSFLDILALKDSGLVMHGEFLRFSFNATTAGSMSHLIYGPLVILFDRTTDTPVIGVDALLLTKAGIEIISLIQISPSMAYVQKIAQVMHAEGVQASWAQIQGVENELIRFGPKFPLPHS